MQWWVSMSTNGHRYPHLKGKQANKKCQSSWREKMDFSRRILDQKRQSFCRICIVLTREQQYTYLRGRRRLSWCRRCLGGRYHGDEERPRRILCVSTWYWFGRSALWPNQYQVEMRRKSCTWDILWIAAMSCLWKIWVSGPRKRTWVAKRRRACERKWRATSSAKNLVRESKFLKHDYRSSTFAIDHLELESNKPF
jgi:hypothetical protein